MENFKDIQEMLFKLVGGLGLFLIGMRFMSDGLQSVAGPTLRKIISAVTNIRVVACFIGIIVTCIVQSSSVTTVMTVGLVNSGIMELHQAIGIILGANIGTTVTGWVLVLKIGKWGLPILGVATFFYLFGKQQKIKFLAMAVLGIGLIFFGLETMKSGVKVIKSIPSFNEAFLWFNASTYAGVLKCALIGCILTVLVQSSSATLGITIALASEGVIDFETAAALVLGENIGTTITAYIASIGTTINAKRAAYFHILFNITGVIWVTSIFSIYLVIVRYILNQFFGIPNVEAMKVVDGNEIYPHVTTGIATVHSVFNIVNTLIFLPFVFKIANILNKYVGRKKQGSSTSSLNFQHFESPAAALEISNHELQRMRSETESMFTHLDYILKRKENWEKEVNIVFELEQKMDDTQKELTTFLSELLGQTLIIEDVESAKEQLGLADEYESVSDYITAITKLLLRLRDNNQTLSNAQCQEITHLHSMVLGFYNKVTSIDDFNESQIQTINEDSTAITDQFRKLRETHWERLNNEKVEPIVSTTYMDIIQNYRKIKNHLSHIPKISNEVV